MTDQTNTCKNCGGPINRSGGLAMAGDVPGANELCGDCIGEAEEADRRLHRYGQTDAEATAALVGDAAADEKAQALAALKAADAAWREAAYVASKARRTARAMQDAAIAAGNAYGVARNELDKLLAANPANSK